SGSRRAPVRRRGMASRTDHPTAPRTAGGKPHRFLSLRSRAPTEERESTGVRKTLFVVAAALLVAPLLPLARAGSADFFAGCAPATAQLQIVVGQVACQQVGSAALGGTTAFSYFVPPACAPAAG